MVKILAVKDGVTSKMNFAQMLADDGVFKVFECGSCPEKICRAFNKVLPDIVIVSEAAYRKYACNRLGEIFDRAKLVLITSHDQKPDKLRNKSIDRPPRSVCAVIAADIGKETLRLVIMSVLSGIFAIQRNIIEQIIDRYGEGAADRNPAHEFSGFNGFAGFSESAAASGLPENIQLSEKELAVIRHVANGLSNKTIAKSLFLSEGRVKNIISGILKKLNLAGRTQLAVYAVNSGICEEAETASATASQPPYQPD